MTTPVPVTYAPTVNPSRVRMNSRRRAERTVDLAYSTFRCAQNGRVLTVRVDAPPFNFMTAAMQEDFIRLVNAVGRDSSVGAVIITGGVPGRYITHYDIADLLRDIDARMFLPGHGPAWHGSLKESVDEALAHAEHRNTSVDD